MPAPMRSLLHLLLLTIPSVLGAYCGTSAIPYSFEVLPDGGTVLGCARPRCFGWEASSGEPASRDEAFQTINGHPDGFLKQGEARTLPFLPSAQQTAVCLPNPAGCLPDQWVGGIVEHEGSLSVTCCSYPALFNAENRGVATLHPGEIFVGGDADGSTFDYVQNIVPIHTAKGVMGYDVSVRRMSCIEPQPMPTIQQYQHLQQVQHPPQSFIQQQSAYGIQQTGNSPYYYPMQSYVPCMSGGSCQCFAADSLVRLEDDSLKRMDQLTMMEWVKTPGAEFNHIGGAPLTNWLHRNAEEEAEFILITTEGGKSLKITREHYIYRAPCNVNITNPVTPEMVPVRKIEIGDCLLEEVARKGLKPVRVIKLSTVTQKGIYAPLTSHGAIMVDGIATSCYSEASDNTVIQTVLKNVGTCSQEDTSLKCAFEGSTMSLLLEMMQLALPEAVSF